MLATISSSPLQVYHEGYLHRPGALAGVREELELQWRCRHPCVAASRGVFWSRPADRGAELCVVSTSAPLCQQQFAWVLCRHVSNVQWQLSLRTTDGVTCRISLG